MNSAVIEKEQSTMVELSATPEDDLIKSSSNTFWPRFRRNRLALGGLAFVLFIILWALVGPYIYPKSPEEIDLLNPYALPSLSSPLGTDESGRDILARLIYGARVSLLVGVAGAAIAIGFGGLIGSLAGYFGGTLDNFLMRITDSLLAVPLFFLLLAVVSILGAGVENVILALGFTRWAGVARLVRGEFLRFKSMDFVMAARAVGARDRRIILLHLLPQATPSIIVAATLGIAQIILVESSLSFLGLGVQPPTPTWGNMLSNSQNYIWNAPQLAVYPGVMILLTVLAFNALGDGLRDAWDPFRVHS